MIIYQILLALCYMHSKNITHRDLKPENLMVTITDSNKPEDLFVKLTDFGFATFFDPTAKMDVILGTPIYMAPELCNNKEYDCRVDVWSLGIIAHVLLSGEAPYGGKDNAEIRDQILN